MANLFKPHVLLTAVAMPAMLGTELALRMVAAVPSCRVVFLTSEAKLLRATSLKLALPKMVILEKPATAAELRRAVLGKRARSIVRSNFPIEPVLGL